MARWLLSGHNARETMGVSYPLTGSYFANFMGTQNYLYLLRSLSKRQGEFDMAMPGMLLVQGYVYVNINAFTRNLGRVLPFEPASLGAPDGLVAVEGKVHLSTRLLLPVRLWRIYRETTDTYRTVVPRYHKLLDDVYWQLRASDHGPLQKEGKEALARLFDPHTVEDAVAFNNAYNMVTVVNIAISRVVHQRAPALLNLLVGRETSTAQLATRVWELRRLAQQCGPAVCDELRRGETDLDKYRRLPEATPLLEGIDRFMREYGHRSFHYASEFEATRLADQPDLLLLTLADLLEEDESPATRARGARQVGLEALQQMAPLSRMFWRFLLQKSGRLIELREENRDHLELQNATYGLAAQQLANLYLPGRPPDTLWLYTFEELLAFGQSRGQQRLPEGEVERRRANLQRYRELPPPPDSIWYDPDTEQWSPVQEEEAREEGTRLYGLGASAGQGPVEGLAVVTNSAQEAAERLLGINGPVVLITHVTDPVWSSLFRRLAAVVTELGGVVSHAALVARENGLPAVVGVHDATRRVADGQWVRVDGAEGTVEVIR